MTRLTILATSALGGLLFLSGPAFAQSGSTWASDAPPANPSGVVVTASRLPGALADTPDAYVIDRAQIESRGAVFAADLLAAVPGAVVGENGFGGPSSLSLRGASSDKTLVLIDGVPVNDPSQPQAGFDFSSLDLASTQRIEVLSGPQGALWGSDAIGGVVSITSLEPNGVSLAGEAGSLATYREVASAGVSASAYAAGVAYSGFRTAGVPNADEKFGNTQPDGFNDATVALNVRFDPTDRISLDARARYVHSSDEYDLFSNPRYVSDPTASSVTKSETGYARARVKDMLGFDQELRVDLMGIDRDYYGRYPFGARGDQQAVRWSSTRQTPLWGLQWGLEYKRSAENTGGGPVSRTDDGAFLIGRFSPSDRLSVTASVRQDQYQGFSGQTTGRGQVSYKLGAGFSILASASQGFNAPSVYEITYPCRECVLPGPPKGLKAEQALGEDAALDWRSADGAFGGRVTAFGLSVANQIDYVYPRGYVNLSSADSAGLEFSGDARLGHGLSLRVSYSHIEGVEGTGPAELLRIPRDSGAGSADWQGELWGHKAQGEIGFRGQDQAEDYYGALAPYMIAYANLRYEVMPHLAVTARVENLGNTHYEQSYGYGEAGRMALIGLSWR
ncbi:MAG TPA: TonB-dependent receptor [Caulobacteraceae bacterium]|nr:TonB-dependent receptor [Caulobacteraceae bacterium]